MEEEKRFIKTTSAGGAWFIRDRKEGRPIAVFFKGDRPQEQSEAMLKVMLDALNKAVERRK